MKIFQIKPRSKGKHQIYQINPHDFTTNPSSIIQKFSQTFIRYQNIGCNKFGFNRKEIQFRKKNKKDGTFSVLQDTSIDSDDRGRQRRGLLFVLLYRERERERERERRWRPLDSQFRNWEGSVGTVVFTFQ